MLCGRPPAVAVYPRRKATDAERSTAQGAAAKVYGTQDLCLFMDRRYYSKYLHQLGIAPMVIWVTARGDLNMGHGSMLVVVYDL